MTEKELIAQIKGLRQIKPSKDWVVLTKKNILGDECLSRRSFLDVFRFRFVFAPLLAVLILVGLFGSAQYSLPGNLLYYVKRAAEKSRAVFVSAEAKPQYELVMANKRLEELNKIAENNKVKNIAPALNEFQKTKAVAKKSVFKSIKGKSEKEAIKMAKNVAPELNRINKNEEKIFGSLGIASEENASSSTTDKVIIELLIKDGENSTLTESQSQDLNQVKSDYESGDYARALEFYMTSSLSGR